MIFGVLISIFAGLVAILKFVLDFIKNIFLYLFDKLRFLSDMVKNDNEIISRVKKHVKQHKRSLKLNNEL